MSVSSVQPILLTPSFDLAFFMDISQERHISNEAINAIMKKWDTWLPHIHAYKLLFQESAYFLVYLDLCIEEEIDSLWKDSPSEAFRLNALAQMMCMSMVHSVIPEVESIGCAPSPRMTKALQALLLDAGISYICSGNAGISSRRYSVLTYFSFKGSCEVCALQKDCPKDIHCGKSAHII